jgi:hypothetical protein
VVAIGNSISGGIPIGVSSMPIPCCGKGVLQVSELRLPFQLLLNLRRIAVNLCVIPLDPFLLFGSPPARIQFKLIMSLSEMFHKVQIVLEREAKM